jgi:hypothetical protein
MSKRTIRDYISAAFLARDKATADAIIKDAEENLPPPQEGEGDSEGSGDDKGQDGDGDKHASNIHIHVEHGKSADTVEGRIAKLEDNVATLSGNVQKVLDAMAKDDDPPWLKGEGEEKEEEPTADEGGDDPSSGEKEEGALSAKVLTPTDPDLMEADPPLKTGEMMVVKHTGSTVCDDAAHLKAIRQQVKDVRAKAEILSPGIKFPTFDAKPDKETQQKICDMRRATLTKALGTKEGKRAIGSFSADSIKGMSCATARTLFNDASERMANANNAGISASSGYHVVGDEVFVPQARQVEQLKSINKNNADFWARQTGAIRH